MTYILIADSGSTKTHWLIKSSESIVREFYTQGINPNFVSTDEIMVILSDSLSNKEIELISHIHFYGAGCKGDEKCNIIKSAFSNILPSAICNVNSDLLASAISLFPNNKSGVACILGTGSNVAIFDGVNFTDSIFSLGYILGDEGSGAYLGKVLLRDFFQGKMPKHISNIFKTRFSIEYSEVINSVYRENLPNKYLAKYAIFLGENRGEEYVESVLKNAFSLFISNQLSSLDFDKNKLEVGFIGSIAFHFKDVITELLKNEGYKVGSIYKEPMEGLVNAH